MKVLIATDGSRFSKAAIEEFTRIVSECKEMAIKVISVFEVPTPIVTEPLMGLHSYYEEVTDSVKALSQGYADQAIEIIARSFPNTPVTKEVTMGTPSQTVVECAEEWGAELIVVGSHGRGFWSRTLLGSVSDAVVHHARCSVLVVRSLSSEANGTRSKGLTSEQE